MNALIGQPVSRVDGPVKVTGQASYAAEFRLRTLAYGAIVPSRIASGRISKLDASAAERAPGVLPVIWHENCERLPYHKLDPVPIVDPKSGQPLRVMQTAEGTVRRAADRRRDRRDAGAGGGGGLPGAGGGPRHGRRAGCCRVHPRIRRRSRTRHRGGREPPSAAMRMRPSRRLRCGSTGITATRASTTMRWSRMRPSPNGMAAG